MSRLILTPILLIVSSLAFGQVHAVSDTVLKAQKEAYHLVWSDEFNTDGSVNPANWTFEKGFVRNKELQWYQEDNVFCAGGNLIIEGRKEHRLNPDYIAGSPDWKKNRQYIEFTSGCVKTAGLKSWKYGRFMMRGRINTAAGLWPAFWTLGEKGHWPFCGEIDIMEFYRQTLLTNVAVGGEQPLKAAWHTSKHLLSSFTDPDWSQKFHVWRMDWDEQQISLFVDDQLLNQVSMSALYNKDGSGVNPFQQPHYLLLNLAIGGTRGGDPDATSFPNRFEIDYVRVYERIKP